MKPTLKAMNDWQPSTPWQLWWFEGGNYAQISAKSPQEAVNKATRVQELLGEGKTIEEAYAEMEQEYESHN